MRVLIYGDFLPLNPANGGRCWGMCGGFETGRLVRAGCHDTNVREKHGFRKGGMPLKRDSGGPGPHLGQKRGSIPERKDLFRSAIVIDADGTLWCTGNWFQGLDPGMITRG